MNKKLTATLALLMICFSLCVVQSKQRPTKKNSVGAKSETSTKSVVAVPEIDAYGTLRGLKNANGDNFFGKDTPMAYDGYAIAYRLGKVAAQGEPQIVSAIKEHITTNQLVPIKSDNTALADVKTKDGALQITSHFAVHSRPGILVVAREIKNLSTQPVSLLALEVHADARFSQYRNSEQLYPKPGSLKDAIAAGLILKPYGGPRSKCLTCDPCIMPCPDWCPPCESALAPDSCAENVEGANVSPVFSIRRCGAPCLLKPEICKAFERRLVSYWSAGGRLPISLAPGSTIIVRMGYYLR